MKRTTACLLAIAVSMSAIPLAGAQSQGMGGMDMKGDKKAQGKVHKGTGVVKSVDAQKGTVTLAHGPIKSLDWPSMTMRFSAKDKKMLEAIKPGDKVEFEFVQESSKNTITSIK